MRGSLKYLTGLIALILCIKATAQVGCNLAVIAAPTGTSCSNLCNGSVTLTPSGGTAPYTLNAFDHSFPGTQLDATLFTVSNGIYQVADNVLTAVPDINANTAYNNFISTKQAFLATGKLVAEASMYIGNNAYGYWGLGQNVTLTSPFQMPIAFFFSNGSLYTSNNGSNKLVGGYSSNTWYDFKIEKIGATVNFYFRQTGISSYTLVSSQTTTSALASYKIAATYRNVYDTYGGFKSMNWRIGGNPPTTNLCAGTYTYTIYDALGCYTTTPVTVGSGTGPSSINLNGTVTPASCAVAADGGVALVPSGGSAPYSFGLAQGFTGNTINTSMFEIRNGNFSQNGALREGINNSASNGWDNSIATRQTFSDGGYLKFEGSFSFDPSAEAAFGFTDNAPVNSLSSILFGFWVGGGNRLYTIGGPNGVQAISTVLSNTYYDFKIEKIRNKVSYYTRLKGNATYDLVYTSLINTSVIEFRFGAVNFSNASAGLGGYTTKDWSVLVTPKVSRLTPGTYTYTITDAAGCSATTVFSVGQSAAPGVLNATLVNGSSSEGATGEVSISPAGGQAPYKYQLEESFGDSIINEGLFTVRNGAFEEGADLRSNNTSINPTFDNGITTNLGFTDGGRLSFAGTFRFDAGVNTIFGFSSYSAVVNDPGQMAIAFSVNGTQLSGKAGRSNTQVIGTITPGLWYDLMVVKADGLVKFFMRDNGNTGDYTLLYTMPYADSLNFYKAALLVYGPNAGLNTKNWVINSNPPLTGLAPGNYSYTVYDSKNCFGTTTINVPSINRTLTVTNQPTNSSAWNVCDGTVGFSSPQSGSLTLYNVGYRQSFSGSQLPANELTTRNGAYSVNGTLASTNKYDGSNWDNSIATIKEVTDNGYVSVEMEMNFASGSELYFGVAPSTQLLNTYTNMPYAFYYASGKLYAYTEENGSVLIGAALTNTWFSFKIEKIGTVVNFLMKPVLDMNYQQVYTTTTSRTGFNYKAGIVNYFDSRTSFNRGFNSRNWYLINKGSLSNICLGNYTYLISAPGMKPVLSSFTVNTNFSQVNSMVGPADINATTDPGVAYATVSALGSPTFSGNASNLVVTNNAPARFNVGVTNVTWTALDAWGNRNTGIQKVTVTDREAPQIIAPADITVTLIAGQTFATGVNLGVPVTSDNASAVTTTNNAPAQFPVGTTTITWTAADASGNLSTATQTITIKPSLIPAVTPPANITTTNNAGQAFATGVNLGNPTFAGSTVGLTITNNAPVQFPIGTTTITWTVTDLGGNMVTANQMVTVRDADAPVITAPAALVVPTDVNLNYASGVNLGTPVYSDNAPGVTVSNNAPLQFPVGTTIVTWTARDAAGNTTTATQTLTVVAPPTISSPVTLIVPTDVDESFATISSLVPPAVNAYNFTISNDGSGQYNIGTNFITWTVTDQWNRTSTATQKIIVAGTPSLAAPGDITIPVASSGSTVTGVVLGTPVYSVYGSPMPTNNAPSIYAVGTTEIIWTVTDQWGRTASDIQTVTVIVPPLPTITAPASIVVSNDLNQPYATITNIGTPTYSVFNNASTPTNNAISTGRYPIGTTYVVWTIKDQFGRTASATQTITVNSTCLPYSVSITSVLNSTIQTGSGPGVIYLGYGAQSTTLQVSVPSLNGPYSFTWTGPAGLSSYTSAAPVFTPTKEGSYVFYVTATNVKGCTSTGTITICVRDVRVLDIKGKWDGKKVYVCHLPPGNPANAQVLSVSINAVAAHVPLHGGDGLGKTCTQPCSNTASRGTMPVAEVFNAKAFPNPSTDYFTLLVKSDDKYTRVTVRIVDAFGRLVQLYNNVTVDRELLFGDKYASGSYYAEVIQGETRKVIPLIKVK
jgi:hypothetical protein